MGGRRTLLVDHFVGRRLPFILVENFDDDNISVNSAIHVFSANQKDRLCESWDWHSALEGSVIPRLTGLGRTDEPPNNCIGWR